jgi:hypothetical protein
VFYTSDVGPILRFGDVIKGLPSVLPQLDKDRMSPTEHEFDLSINTDIYCAVLTPCCSIERGMLNIAPLRPILPSFLKNPYFNEDLTRLNRRMPPERVIPPDAWDALPEEQRARRLAEGITYAFLESFVYDSHDLLPDYDLHQKGGPVRFSHYRIDFRESAGVSCQGLDRGTPAPPGVKVLQLSAEARDDLREKMAYYYVRPAVDDEMPTAS